MKQILCFGDSNTYGYIPGGAGRYPFDVRWTGVLSQRLGAEYHIAEDGLVGRTTVFREQLQSGRVGADALPKSLATCLPDILILMLGTNDCKAEFGASAQNIADGMLRLTAMAEQLCPGVKIILAAPAPLHEVVLSEGISDYNEQSYTVSHKLAEVYRAAARKKGYGFVDVGCCAVASPVDGEHLAPEHHTAIADALYREVLRL